MSVSHAGKVRVGIVLEYLQLEHAPSPAVTRLFEKRRGVVSG
jgi:hypothetical protein